MSDLVEGQDIALDVFSDAHDRGWQAFRERYEARLMRLAQVNLRQTPMLCSFGQAEDLVQGFLAEQVIERRQSMLGPTARGEKPLWPRLSRSFANYCKQILRRIGRHPTTTSDSNIDVRELVQVRDERDRDEVWGEIRQRIEERQDSIRRSFSEQDPGMAPLLYVILLSERLLLAQQIQKSFSESNSNPYSDDPVPIFVAGIVPWSDNEKNRSLPPRNISLGEAWDSLSRPMILADGDSIARVLGVQRNTWDQWIRRSRLRVVRFIGPKDCQRLFPHWPGRLTANFVGPENVGGGSTSPC